jgi:hypothetical protein
MGKVHSHRFPGANTALPFVNHDAQQLKVTQDFLRDGQVTIDIFGMARTGLPPLRSEKQKSTQEGPTLASTLPVGEESANFGGGPARSMSLPVEVIAPLDKVNATVRGVSRCAWKS